MKQKIQTTFFIHKTFKKHDRKLHGGDIGKGERKQYRPIDLKRPLHLVMRSSQAKGARSMLHPRNVFQIKRLLHKWSTRFDVKVYGFTNSGNHLHLIVKARTRRGFQGFLRTFTALTARLVLDAKKGAPARLEPNPSKRKFWDGLAFSRIVSWGRDFLAARRYLLRNKLEAVGFLVKDERVMTFKEALANKGMMLIS